MKLKLKYIMLSLALAVGGCAAYFSVWGLSQLFAGASTAVIIMASVLEIGKIVTTTALHTYWDKLAKPLKFYLSISVIVLMFITSAGIYGFLSNAYQSTANKLEIHEGELGVLDVKKQTFEKSVLDNQKLIETKTKRLDQLSNLRSNQENRLDNSSSNRSKNSVRNDIKLADTEIQKLNTEIDVLNAKNVVLSDSINVYNVKAIELKAGSSVSAEVGPLKYIAQLTGVSMASVVNYLILLLIFVFDPLAVALVLITNKVFQIENETQTNEKLVKVEEDLTQIKKPKTYQEPFEYYDEEYPNNPIFENIPEPIDEEFERASLKVGVTETKEQEEETEVELEPISEDEEIIEEVTKDEIIEKEEEVTEIENEVAVVEEEVAIVEDEVSSVENEQYLPKGKITLEDIKEVKERNRGFSVNVPEPKRNNAIQRIVRR